MTTKITISCPACSATLAAPESAASAVGKTLLCPKCRKVIPVPPPTETALAAIAEEVDADGQQPYEFPILSGPRSQRNVSPARTSRRCQWTLFAVGWLAGASWNRQADSAQIPLLLIVAIGFMAGRTLDTGRYRHWLFFPVVLIVSLASMTPSAERIAALRFSQGVDAMKSQQYDLAISRFSEAISLVPSNPAAHFNRGIAHLAQSEFDAALADFTRAIQLDRNFLKAYVNRSLTYFEMGQYELAVADCNVAVGIDANCDLAFYIRGLSFQEMGQLDNANADIEKAFQINPKLSESDAR